MNVAFFLTPKNDVAFLYEDFTLRQALEKMKAHGYSAIPVITRDGKYCGTVREGDFLWYFLGDDLSAGASLSAQQLQSLTLAQIGRSGRDEPVNITATVEQLMERAVTQNFVPVVDDLGSFIGIITRRDIIRYFYNRSDLT